MNIFANDERSAHLHDRLRAARQRPDRVRRASRTVLAAGLLGATVLTSAAVQADDYGAQQAEAKAQQAALESGDATAIENTDRRYTFSWMFTPDDAMKPRGGTTRGPEIVLQTEPSDDWLELQAPGLSDKERDRRAILAMAGGYRVSFDFIETIGFTEGYEPSRPYQSWGTEYVYVVADEPDFISLQHILVMVIEQDDGSLSDPMVIKHWRQDWTWEDRDLQQYAGFNTWDKETLTRKASKGTWSQAVFQVDDSPRYETYGSWTHEPGYSHWQSERTWRPLPRREFSVRDDYHALVGAMRISITPTGWVMEEDALKTVLNDDGTAREQGPYLAREAGISRYQRIVDYDFSAGDEYWQRTGPFWAQVRGFWRDLYDESEGFGLHKSVDGKPLFAALFGLAEAHSGPDVDPEAIRADLDETLAPYLRR